MERTRSEEQKRAGFVEGPRGRTEAPEHARARPRAAEAAEHLHRKVRVVEKTRLKEEAELEAMRKARAGSPPAAALPAQQEA